MRQGVVRRPQVLVAGVGAEAGAVDQRLRVLDAEADRERLGLEIDAALMQPLEGVARAVAQRQHHVVGADVPAAFQHHPAQAARPVGGHGDVEIHHLALEAVLAAQLLDGLAHPLHHGHQAEGADVGVGLGQDLGRSAGLDELGQHLAAQVAGVLDLAVELAVREGAGPALAELHVGLRVQHALAPQAPGVLGALAHHLATLQDDRAQAHLGQDQAGEQAARPGPDHQRAVLGQALGVADEAVLGVGRRLHMALALEARQHLGLVAHGHVH